VIDQVNKPTKAALLSALVFPGVGHIFLKKYVLGVVLAGVSFFGVYYLTLKMLEVALQLTEKIQSGDVPIDIMAITEMVESQAGVADDKTLNLATTALAICWVIGVIDSFRVGCIQGKIDRNLVD